MALQAIRDALPAYAADLRANLEAIGDDRLLSSEERWGCLLACALAAGEPTLLKAVVKAAAEPLGARGVEAAKAAAAVTLMNDAYYGSVGGLRNAEYATQPSGLRMEALHHPGADRNAFDLWCLSVSTVDRCTSCMDAQDEELRRRGTPPARIQAAMRIASVVRAVARVLAAETALQAKDGEEGDSTKGEARGATGAPADGPEGSQAQAPPPPGAGTADPAVTTTPRPAPGDMTITPG